MAISTDVGNGESTLFWTDRWQQGRKIADLASLLFAAIPQARRKRRTVQQAFQNHAWTADIQGVVTIEIIVEYIQLWELLLDIQLQTEVEDTHFWRLSVEVVYDTSPGITTRAARGCSLMERLKLSTLKQDGHGDLRGSDRRSVIPYVHREDYCVWCCSNLELNLREVDIELV
jgi:hypothetical protein